VGITLPGFSGLKYLPVGLFEPLVIC
jgi:hypothetical protein